MTDTEPQSGSLTIEECRWSYETLAATAKYTVSYLRKFVHWGLLREGIEYKKRNARVVWFHPERAMKRLAWIWENPDVLREAKKEMASRIRARREKGDQELRNRTGS